MKDSGAVVEHSVEILIEAKLVTVIAGVIVVLAPIIITLSPHLSIRAMSWFIEFQWSRFVIDYSPYLWFSTFPLTCPRLIFIYQISRYYEHKSSRAMTVLVGILTDIPMWFVSLLLIYSGLWGPTISIPTPFMALFGIIMMWKWSYPEPQKPW
ncbi:MAG: hypothetical protein ACFFDD_14505 [Promethearchaeota archaeon]